MSSAVCTRQMCCLRPEPAGGGPGVRELPRIGRLAGPDRRVAVRAGPARAVGTGRRDRQGTVGLGHGGLQRVAAGLQRRGPRRPARPVGRGTDAAWPLLELRRGPFRLALTLSRLRHAVDGELVRRLRYWTYTGAMVKAQNAAARLPLSQAHACINDVKGRIGVLRTNLEKKRQPVVATVVGESTSGRERPADSVTAPPVAPPRQPTAAPARLPPRPAASARKPRRPLWELLLDPRSIQWLLGFGGACWCWGW